MRRNDPGPYDFKVGDKVICIYNIGEERHLNIGQTYQVVEISERNMLKLNAISYAFFYGSRFIPATSLNKELV